MGSYPEGGRGAAWQLSLVGMGPLPEARGPGGTARASPLLPGPLGELRVEHGPKECTEVTHSVERDGEGLTWGSRERPGTPEHGRGGLLGAWRGSRQGAGAEGMLGEHSGFMETEVGCPGGTGRWVVWARDRNFENVTGAPLARRELQALHTPSPAHRHGLPESWKAQARLASGNCPKGLRQLKKYLFNRIY